MSALDDWIAVQRPHAIASMRASISPLGLVKRRPGFGHEIHPRRGAIIASPVLAAYDPEPDYFFHWYRDGAIVADALRLLHEDGSLGATALADFGDFVRFSLSLRSLDGRELVAQPQWRGRVRPDFERYVRDAAELAAVHGDAVAAETRVNPDGSLDISRWSRPQHDGPPLRALTLLRWLRSATFEPALAADVAQLLAGDLEFTRKHWREACHDIWEEELGLHYYTLCVSATALDQGADWLSGRPPHGPPPPPAGGLDAAYRAEAATIRRQLDGYWLADAGHYRSRFLASGERSTKELDIAVILAAVHGRNDEATHSVRDPRMHATLDRLAALFDAAYPINRHRPANRGPAMGRYAGDVYYAGGAYFFSTFGAAEFCYLAARRIGDQGHDGTPGGGAARDAWIARGDAFLEAARAYTPASGDLAEQFDQRTGEPASARHLAWSYAAFISSVAARQAARAPAGDARNPA